MTITKDHWKTKRLINGRWAVVNERDGKMQQTHYANSVLAQRRANQLNRAQ